MAIMLRWWERVDGQLVLKAVYLPDDVDVVEIRIPVQENVPAINVNVNNDAVVIDNGDTGSRLGMVEFHELVAEANADI